MEGISVAANGIAVVSVAFQLTESCIKMYRFWESVEDAPQEIASVKEDLRYLISVFKRIESSNHAVGSCIADGIRYCQLKVVELAQIVKQFEPGLNSSSRRRRKWTALKAAAGSEHIQRFRNSLNDTKSTLTLALVQQCIETSNYTSGPESLGISVFEPSINAPMFAKQKQIPFLDQVVDKRPQRRTGHGTLSPPRCTEVDPIQRIPCTSFLEMSKKVLFHVEQSLTQDDVYDRGIEQLMLQSIEQVAVRGFEANSHEIFAHDGYTLKDSGAVQSRTFVYAERSKYHIRHHASKLETGLGCIQWNTTTISKQKKTRSTKKNLHTVTSIVFYPTYWLQLFGMRSGFEAIMASAGRTWLFNCKLQVTRAVPEDSLIFRLCEEGEIRAVELLLSTGQASVVDTSPRGWKPLHFAAARGHVDLCAMLIEAGADKSALAYEGLTASILSPISLFVAHSSGIHADQKIAMLRLFSDCIDLSDSQGEGWNVHTWLKRAYAQEKVPISKNSITWLFHSTANEEYVELAGSQLWAGLQHAVRTVLGHERQNNFLQRILRISEKSLSDQEQITVNTLSQLLAFGVLGQVLLPLVLGAGAFLQVRGFDWIEDDMTHRQYLRILPSMYTAWCKSLLDCIDNLEKYIESELNQYLQSLGWTRSQLLHTLSDENMSSDQTHNDRCTQCNTSYTHLPDMLLAPVRITLEECAQTYHQFDCTCEILYDPLASPTSEDIPPYQGRCSTQTRIEDDDDDDDFFHDAKYYLDNVQPGPPSTGMFSTLATLLYRAHGRHWMSEYTPDERLCLSCFFVRERYTDPFGFIAEFPDVPEHYKGLRFKW